MSALEENKEEHRYENLNNELKIFVNRVNEESAVYLEKREVDFSSFFDNKLLIIHSIRRGISYKLFNLIKDISPFSDADWSEFLNISTKTLQRNKKEEHFRFKPIHSEKILELAEVNKLGMEVFDSKEKLNLWLNSPSHALGKNKPIELLKDSYGKEMVISELNRIDHGIFA